MPFRGHLYVAAGVPTGVRDGRGELAFLSGRERKYREQIKFPTGSTQPAVGWHRVTVSAENSPKVTLPHTLAGESTGESMLVFTRSFSVFICEAQRPAGRLKEREGAMESPAHPTASLCQGQQGLASLLPSSQHLADILKKNPTTHHNPIEKQYVTLRVEVGDAVRSSPPSVMARVGA